MNIIVPATFDLFHEGHKKLLLLAEKMSGNNLIVVIVNSDELSLKNGKKTVNNTYKRVENVKSFMQGKNYEVYVSNKEGDTIFHALKISPCLWLTGRDWNIKKTSKRNNVEECFWEKNEVYLVYKDREKNVSTTKIKKEMKKN